MRVTGVVTLLFFFAFFIGVLLWFFIDNKTDNFHRIKMGMSIQDVLDQIGKDDPVLSAISGGPPGPIVGVDADAYYVWKRPRLTFYVAVKDGKVIYKKIEKHGNLNAF